MKTHITYLLKLLCVSIVLLSPLSTLHSQVAVVPSGGHTTVGSAEMTVSIGQCAIQTVYDTAVTVSKRTASLTEGVIQPYLTFELSIPDGVEPLACTINLYPNPTTQSLNIEAETTDAALHYTLYTISGQPLQQGTLRQRTTLDVADIPSGSYILRIEDSDRNQTNIYKIMKL